MSNSISNTMSLYCPKRHHQVKEHRGTRDSSSLVEAITVKIEERTKEKNKIKHLLTTLSFAFFSSRTLRYAVFELWMRIRLRSHDAGTF